MAGWDWKSEMSNSAALCVKAGWIPTVAVPSDEIAALSDDDYDTIEPHHVLIDDAHVMVTFIEAVLVGRDPMTPEEISEHLSVEPNRLIGGYKAVWK